MSSLTCVLIFMFFVLYQSSTPVTADLIDDTCMKTHKPSLCTSSLRLDPRSSSADTTVFAHIMLELTLNKTKEALAQVKESLTETNDSVVLHTLNLCGDEYIKAIISRLPAAMENLDHHYLRYYWYARGYAEDVARMAMACEEFFYYAKQPSPLPEMNNAIINLARLAEDIIFNLNFF